MHLIETFVLDFCLDLFRFRLQIPIHLLWAVVAILSQFLKTLQCYRVLSYECATQFGIQMRASLRPDPEFSGQGQPRSSSTVVWNCFLRSSPSTISERLTGPQGSPFQSSGQKLLFIPLCWKGREKGKKITEAWMGLLSWTCSFTDFKGRFLSLRM